jgi:hypothetical protein
VGLQTGVVPVHVTEVAEAAKALAVEFGESFQKAVALPIGHIVGVLPDANHQRHSGERGPVASLDAFYNGVSVLHARVAWLAGDEEIDGGAVGR